MVAIEGLYIFDEHNNAILEHVYTGRPPSADILLPAYLSHAVQQSPVIYLPNVNPPTLLCSITQDRLLFLCPTSSDVEPLVIIEFLHRVADAFADFLGSPLLASKIDSSYDVVVQIVGEMCDAGIVSNTEPNALKEVVEAPSWMGNLFGGFGLPTSSPSLAAPGSLQGSASPFISSTSSSATLSNTGPAIPWRRTNVRHTSNELYVDIVEKLSVIMAPSGRPLSAMAIGNIVFTAKISGVPDLLLTLTAPGGKIGIQNSMDLPSFHPCVRLARWRDKPGEISFIPPDGRFMLAGYECNLTPDMFNDDSGMINTPKLDLPMSIDTRSALGTNGDEFEVRLKIKSSAAGSGSGAAVSLSRNLGGTSRVGTSGAANAFGAGSGSSTPSAPAIEDVVVTVPVSRAVRTVEDLKAARGEANFLASEGIIEWRLSSKEAATISSAGVTLRCTMIGHRNDREEHANGVGAMADTYDYDEDSVSVSLSGDISRPKASRGMSSESRNSRRMQQNAALMPRSANLSFSMKGWLASGIKVDGLSINTKTSKGLGAGVTPYKGVKYHTVSEHGIEVRT